MVHLQYRYCCSLESPKRKTLHVWPPETPNSFLFKIARKDFAMLGKPLSAYDMYKEDLYSRLLVSHSSLSETDATLPDYAFHTAKPRQLYKDYNGVVKEVIRITAKVKEACSWMNLSTSYSRLYLDCHTESLQPYSLGSTQYRPVKWDLAVIVYGDRERLGGQPQMCTHSGEST